MSNNPFQKGASLKVGFSQLKREKFTFRHNLETQHRKQFYIWGAWTYFFAKSSGYFEGEGYTELKLN